MRGKLRQKTEPRRWQQRPEEGEGSRWELILFGLFFVTIVFMVGTYARADVADSRVVDRPSTRASWAAKPLASNAATSAVQASFFRSGMTASDSPSASSDGTPTTASENRLRARIAQAKRQKSRQAFEFGGALTIEGTRSLDPDTETNYIGNIQIQPSVVYTPWNVSANLKFIYNRELVYERDDGTNGDIDDVRYTFRKAWRRDRDFQVSFVDEVFAGLGGFLPASRLSKKRGFSGSIGPRFGGMKKLGRWTLAGSFIYTRSGYSEDIDASGRTNNADAYTSVSKIEFALTERLSLGGALEYTYLVDYQNVDSGAERGMIELGYKWTEHLSTSLGFATSRATVDSTGQTELFKFYDKESALAYFDLVVSI